MLQVKKFTFNTMGENTFLLFDETRESVILDCGAFTSQEKDQIQAFITENELYIKHLLCTHLHLDHVFGNAFVSEKYGLFPQYHELEETLPSLQEQALAFGMNLQEVSPKAIVYLQDGDILSFGNSELKVLFVPGHSPGGVCFYAEKEKILFSGDSLFAGSVGRSDLWGGDSQKLLSGIKKKLFSLPDDVVVYAGHGPETTVGREKETNPFLR